MTMLLMFLMMASVPPPDLVTIGKGTLSGIERPREAVVRTEAEWRSLWQEHAPGQAMPPIDFGQRNVIAVFLGSRNTAGYAVEITAVEKDGAGARVRYRETRPGEGDMLAQIITSPFHIVSVPRIDPPVSFAREHGH